MFNAISWSQYGLAVFLLLVVYYAYVVAVYYRHEVTLLLKGRKADSEKRQSSGPSAVPSQLISPSLIIPSLITSHPAQPEEVFEPETDQGPEEREENEVADPSVEAGEEQNREEESETADQQERSEEAELGEDSSLVGVAVLSNFLDKVEAGEFSEETAAEAPAALENTELLQNIFTAGLTRRRALLAVLEE